MTKDFCPSVFPIHLSFYLLKAPQPKQCCLLILSKAFGFAGTCCSTYWWRLQDNLHIWAVNVGSVICRLVISLKAIKMPWCVYWEAAVDGGTFQTSCLNEPLHHSLQSAWQCLCVCFGDMFKRKNHKQHTVIQLHFV